ncbi:hypothetical protein XNA1_2110002 [Xenorhabdus nematophila str. Anatoliense]|nr:hypothetical protein XNA1_2110002 [Xenorhabdus nematophila str. Anatoliense]
MNSNIIMCKEAFEKEIKKTYPFDDDNYPTLAQNKEGNYYNIITQSKWELWQQAWNSSRDINIGLPKDLDCNKGNELNHVSGGNIL